MLRRRMITPPTEGSDWVRIWIPPVDTPVLDGTTLVVPPGTEAIVSINGVMTTYRAGSHLLMTGTSRMGSFFGYGADVRVIYVALGKTRFLPVETDLLLQDPRFGLTLRAKVKGNLEVSVSDAAVFAEKIVGGFASDVTNDAEILHRLTLPALRSIHASSIAAQGGDLEAIGEGIARQLQPRLSRYGLWLEDFSVQTIDIPDEQLTQVRQLEQEIAAGRVKTGLELENIQQIWGSVDKRTQAEIFKNGGAAMDSLFELVKLLHLLPMLPGGGYGGYGEIQPYLLGGGLLPPPMPVPGHTAALPPPLPGRTAPRTHAVPLPARGTAAQTARCPMCGSVLSGTGCTVCGYMP